MDGLDEIDDAFLRLRRLWSVSRQRIIDDQGAPVEISSLIVLEACARGASRDVEVTIGDVAKLADVAPSTATRLVDRAVGKGWVNRIHSSINARRTALLLTTDGVGLRQRAVQARQDWLTSRFVDWSESDITRLGVLLTRFADGLEHPR